MSSDELQPQVVCVCILPFFSLSQPAPQGTVGAPFQRATPTRRAPPGAVGTLPPPPGRPVVPGLLWAHYTATGGATGIGR